MAAVVSVGPTLPSVSSLTHCFQLLGDMSTWRSELKKITIAHTPAAYDLTPPGTVLQERTRWVEDAASNLLERSMFLRNGLDENVGVYFCVRHHTNTHRREKRTILLTRPSNMR